MKKFNVEKLVIGILLGVCLTLAIGAGARRGFGTTGSVGKYQIASSAEPYNDGVFVLNTHTGQVWMYSHGKWRDIGHISGIEEVKPRLKAVYRESGITFEKR